MGKELKKVLIKEDILPNFNIGFICNNFDDLNGMGRVRPKVFFERYKKKEPFNS